MTQQAPEGTAKPAPSPVNDAVSARADALLAKMGQTKGGDIELPELKGRALRIANAEEHAAGAMGMEKPVGFDDEPENPVEALDSEVDKTPTDPQTPAAKRSRLEEIAALERQAGERRAAKNERRARANAELEQQRAQLAAQQKALADRDQVWSNPEALLNMLEKHVGPDKLVEWLGAQRDPVKRAQLAAEQAAKAAATPTEQRLAVLEQQLKQAQAQAARSQALGEFQTLINQGAQHVPFAAAALKNDPQWAINKADEIADRMARAGKKFEVAHVVLELDKELRHLSKITGAQVAAPKQQQEDEKPMSRAKGRATTVTNRAAATRTTNASAPARLSYEERTARAERRLRNTQ